MSRYVSIGLPEQIPDQNSQQSYNFKVIFWILSTRHRTQRKVLRSFSGHFSYACFFLTSLSLWSQDYSGLDIVLSLTTACCPRTAACPANVLLLLPPPENDDLILASLKHECAKKPVIYISGVPLPKRVLKHFTICKPLKLHLWKYFAVISVQITHSHVQCALPTTPELTEFHSCARRVAKTSWHIPISFKEAPKHGNECDQSHVSSAKIVFSIQTNAENNLFLFFSNKGHSD